MAEEKKKTTRKKKTTDKITLDKNELSEIITNALLEYNKKKEERVKTENFEEVMTQKPSFWQTIKAIINPRKYCNEDGATIIAIKSAIKTFYQVMSWVLLAIFAYCIAIIPLQYFLPGITSVKWYNNGWYILLAILSFLFSRVFVLLQMELEKMKDNNFLLGLFSSILAIVAIVVAIIV